MTLSTTIKTLAFASMLAMAPSQMMAAQKGGTFTTGDKTFLLNGKPFVVKAAELHYPRIPRAYWEHRIKTPPDYLKNHGYKNKKQAGGYFF